MSGGIGFEGTAGVSAPNEADRRWNTRAKNRPADDAEGRRWKLTEIGLEGEESNDRSTDDTDGHRFGKVRSARRRSGRSSSFCLPRSYSLFAFLVRIPS